jgi:regulator of protease activity HflC (stomatin/prohibitin superfamily)
MSILPTKPAAAERPEKLFRRRRKNILIALFALCFCVVTLWDRLFYTVNSGEGGILFRRFTGGTVTDTTYGEGTHMIPPWDEFFVYDGRIRRKHFNIQILSASLLPIQVEVTCLYRPLYNELPLLHQEVGPDYELKLIEPAMISSVREVVGTAQPGSLASDHNDEMQDKILKHSMQELKGTHVEVLSVIMEKVTLPALLNEAIEAKLRQEQAALAYEFRLKREEEEIKRKLLEARGINEFQETVQKSITNKLLIWKGIEASLELARSPNAKAIIFGGNNGLGLPLILGPDWTNAVKLPDEPKPIPAAAETTPLPTQQEQPDAADLPLTKKVE